MDLYADKARGQVSVGSEPLLEGPALVSENGLDEEHVGQSITNSLVDEVDQSLEALQGMLLSRRLGLGVLDDLQGVLRECDGTVAVGLEVDTDIEPQGSVVQVLHTSVSANDWEFKHLLDVVGAGTVGIGGLNNTNLQLLRNTGIASEIANERGRQSGDTVTIQ